jgi:hypothetical protein
MFYIDQQETSFLKQNKSCLFHLNRNINSNGSRAATKSSPFITTKAKSPSFITKVITEFFVQMNNYFRV